MPHKRFELTVKHLRKYIYYHAAEKIRVRIFKALKKKDPMLQCFAPSVLCVSLMPGHNSEGAEFSLQ